MKLKTKEELVQALTKERDDLANKCDKLEKFTVAKEFANISVKEQELLKDQLFYMLKYVRTLDARLLLRNEGENSEE